MQNEIEKNFLSVYRTSICPNAVMQTTPEIHSVQCKFFLIKIPENHKKLKIKMEIDCCSKCLYNKFNIFIYDFNHYYYFNFYLTFFYP